MATAEVQNAMSSDAMADYQVPVSVVMITQTQDWKTRQKIAYAAQKGLIKEDFLGLADWQEQIGIYSNANPMYLKAPNTAIQALTGRNRNVLMTLVLDPVLGWVGNFLTQVYGLDKTFVAPADVLNNSSDPGSQLGL